jgi:hypothetical protein
VEDIAEALDLTPQDVYYRLRNNGRTRRGRPRKASASWEALSVWGGGQGRSAWDQRALTLEGRTSCDIPELPRTNYSLSGHSRLNRPQVPHVDPSARCRPPRHKSDEEG